MDCRWESFLVGSNPGLRLSFITRDIVLPTAFVVAIVFAVLELRRYPQIARPSNT